MLVWIWLLAGLFTLGAVVAALDVRLITRGRKSVSRWSLEHKLYALPVAFAAVLCWGILLGHLFFPQVVYVQGP